MIDQRHLDFAAIIGIDGSRAVNHGDTVFAGQAAAAAPGPRIPWESRWRIRREPGESRRVKDRGLTTAAATSKPAESSVMRTGKGRPSPPARRFTLTVIGRGTG